MKLYSTPVKDIGSGPRSMSVIIEASNQTEFSSSSFSATTSVLLTSLPEPVCTSP